MFRLEFFYQAFWKKKSRTMASPMPAGNVNEVSMEQNAIRMSGEEAWNA